MGGARHFYDSSYAALAFHRFTQGDNTRLRWTDHRARPILLLFPLVALPLPATSFSTGSSGDRVRGLARNEGERKKEIEK